MSSRRTAMSRLILAGDVGGTKTWLGLFALDGPRPSLLETRRYQTLRSMEGAPNLPSGYASMVGLTYFPPLWRKVMDHRVLAHYGGDLTKVNIHPRMRDKVLAKYGHAAAPQ